MTAKPTIPRHGDGRFAAWSRPDADVTLGGLGGTAFESKAERYVELRNLTDRYPGGTSAKLTDEDYETLLAERFEIEADPAVYARALWLNSEREGARRLAETASAAGVSPAALSASVTESLAQHIADNDITVHVRQLSTVESILADGRFRSTFDANSGRMPSYTGLRAQLELSWFGYPADLPTDERPIFAAVTGSHRNGTTDYLYGDIRIVLKPEVKERSTFSIGDSMNSFIATRPVSLGENPFLAVSDYFAGDLASDRYKDPALEAIPARTERDEPDYPKYVEAQIHGGVKATDIARVEVPPELVVSEKLLSLLAAAGVELARL